METARIRDIWRREATWDRWTRADNQAGAIQGESGGFMVKVTDFNRRAYLKPADTKTDDLTHCRAAREKIASDLAYELNLPVPPACLSKHHLNPVVLSLVMYDIQWSWREICSLPDGKPLLQTIINMALRKCSPMYVFDTWLQQEDHEDHPHNIILGHDPLHPGSGEILFLDYANSMGFRGNWEGDQWQRLTKVGFPEKMCRVLDRNLIEQAITNIESLKDDLIREIVTRIPASHLPVQQKQIIETGLLGRKHLLRRAFSDLLPSEVTR